MKRFLALLLVVALTACFAVVASAADKTYTDVVNLLPTDASKVSQVDGKTDWTVDGGKLTIAMGAGSNPTWPSVEITEAVGKEIDLTATPYVHINVTIPEGQSEVGLNGHIMCKTDDGTEIDLQLSALRFPNVDPSIQEDFPADFPERDGNKYNPATDDYRETTDIYLDAVEWIKARTDIKNPGKITITKLTLSVYVGNGTWNALAFAKEGADEPDQGGTDQGGDKEDSSPEASSPEASTPTSSDKPAAGDSGMLVFAVLGVLSVAGVAVAVKTRR